METVAITAGAPKKVYQSKYDARYVFVICILFSLLILGRAFNDIFFYVFAAVSAAVFVFSNIGHCLSFLFFLLPFSIILKLDVDDMSFFTLLFFLVIVKMVVSYRRIDARLLLALIIFMAYNLLFSGLGQITTIVTMMSGMIMLYYLRSEALKIDVNIVVTVYSLGICFSSLLGAFKELFPIVETFISDITIRLEGAEYANRFTGLNSNPNYYTMDVILAMSAIVALLYYNRKTPKINVLFIVALSVFGVMSVSKSFLLTWILLFFCWFVLSLKQGIGKFSKFLFVFFIGVTFTYYFAYDYVNAYMFRLVEDSSGNMDSITTGRIEIWTVYIREIFDNIKILFFGNGLNTVAASIGKGTHNTYIESLYYLGIFGTCVFASSVGFSVGKIKIKGVLLLPALILMIRMIAIGILTNDSLWFFFALLSMLYSDYQKIHNEKGMASKI